MFSRGLAPEPSMHRGWALLLAIYLLAWVPLRFAVSLLETLPTLRMRGAAAIAELALHGVVTALAVAGGWMVWSRAPAASAFARMAVVASGATTIVSLFYTALPSQVAPGARLPLAALTIVYTAFWLVLIGRGDTDKG
jgi:hypothetical protein